MIFHTKESNLLLKALKKHYANEKSSVLNQLRGVNISTKSMDVKDTINISWEDLGKAYDTDDCSHFPEINLGMISSIKYYGGTKSLHPFFETIDRDVYKTICDVFLEEKIDLANNIQQIHVKRFSHNDIEYLHSSKSYINYILKNDYKYNIDTLDHLVDKLSSMYQKEVQPVFFNLLLKKTYDNQDKNKILEQFKNYMSLKPVISANANKNFLIFKDKIKDWDLKNYFNLAEIKMLYSSEDGVILKKAETLYYNINLGLVRKKTKALQHVIHSNLKLITVLIQEEFGKLPEFIVSSNVFTDSKVEINMLFEKNVKKSILDSLEVLMEDVINSKEQLEKDMLRQKVNATLFANTLDEALDKKEELTVRRKNKI